MSLLGLFRWLAHTWLGITMRDSTWAFAYIEIGHLLALAIFGGSVLMVDLRLLGIALRKQASAVVARELFPVVAGGVVVMAVTGFLLLASGPMRYYYNPAFRAKMALFLAAVILHFILHRYAITSGESEKDSAWMKVGAVMSLVLWISVGLAGRAIGYV